jgi:hypothetical protein
VIPRVLSFHAVDALLCIICITVCSHPGT